MQVKIRRDSGGTEKHELGKEVVVADHLFGKSEKESCRCPTKEMSSRGEGRRPTPRHRLITVPRVMFHKQVVEWNEVAPPGPFTPAVHD